VLPQGEAPPQIHHREDESFYVLEGEFEFLDRDQWIKAAPGSFGRVPKRSLHTLKNTGEEVGRL
jgi:mannose-6-phosphate isomerase-like protein (cupin superfamily)